MEEARIWDLRGDHKQAETRRDRGGRACLLTNMPECWLTWPCTVLTPTAVWRHRLPPEHSQRRVKHVRSEKHVFRKMDTAEN